MVGGRSQEANSTSGLRKLRKSRKRIFLSLQKVPTLLSPVFKPSDTDFGGGYLWNGKILSFYVSKFVLICYSSNRRLAGVCKELQGFDYHISQQCRRIFLFNLYLFTDVCIVLLI